MPLPDAKPDRRIYELLKTTDLENLTFSDFQKVAQTIYAEQGAEDELRRIVLVNLARLSVAGEWSGLTSSGGGGFSAPAPAPSGSQTYQNLHLDPLYQSMPESFSNISVGSLRTRATFYPFVANKSGNVSSIGLHVQTAESKNMLVGIYTMDSNGLPSTKLTEGTISCSSTGDVHQTSLTGTATLTRGTNYYFAYVKEESTWYSGVLLQNETPGVGIAYNNRFEIIGTNDGTILTAYDGSTLQLLSDYTGTSFGTVTQSGTDSMVLATAIVVS